MANQTNTNPLPNQVNAFAAKEAYRTIRTNLMFSLAKEGCKTILFTSSVQGEGKTTTASNVAFSLARSNKKVLLVDMDLRRPHLHRLVKKPSAPGVTNCLSGFNTADEILHQEVSTNLDAICAGTLSPNPSEMVASEGMGKLLKQMQEVYDFIILDTPPINLVSDALSLIPYVDGIILVVRPNYSARKDVQRALEQVQLVGGKILGVVANAVTMDTKKIKRRYGHYGYGKYGYGYGAEVSAPTTESEEQKMNTDAETATEEASEITE